MLLEEEKIPGGVLDQFHLQYPSHQEVKSLLLRSHVVSLRTVMPPYVRDSSPPFCSSQTSQLFHIQQVFSFFLASTIFFVLPCLI